MCDASCTSPSACASASCASGAKQMRLMKLKMHRRCEPSALGCSCDGSVAVARQALVADGRGLASKTGVVAGWRSCVSCSPSWWSPYLKMVWYGLPRPSFWIAPGLASEGADSGQTLGALSIISRGCSSFWFLLAVAFLSRHPHIIFSGDEGVCKCSSQEALGIPARIFLRRKSPATRGHRLRPMQGSKEDRRYGLGFGS